ncbi:protein kinase, partial [Candidatus Margulisiibacteriota bacterium]
RRGGKKGSHKIKSREQLIGLFEELEKLSNDNKLPKGMSLEALKLKLIRQLEKHYDTSNMSEQEKFILQSEKIGLKKSLVFMFNDSDFVDTLHRGARSLGEGGQKKVFKVQDLQKVLDSELNKPLEERDQRLIDNLGKFIEAQGDLKEGLVISFMNYTMLDEKESEEDIKQFFARSIKIGKFSMGLDQENIIKTEKMIFSPGGTRKLSLITEFCEKGDIDNLMTVKNEKGEDTGERKPLPLKLRLNILLGSLKGLDYLHKRNFIHRDMKLQNVLLNKKNVPKIIDFDLGREPGELTEVEEKEGTEIYKAPELVYGKDGKKIASPQSDIYAVGIMGLYMEQGTIPGDCKFLSMTTKGLRRVRKDYDLKAWSDDIDSFLESTPKGPLSPENKLILLQKEMLCPDKNNRPDTSYGIKVVQEIIKDLGNVKDKA